MDVVPEDWYRKWFGNEYLTIYAHRDETEAQVLIRLIQSNIQLPAHAKILDLCCGQGRHARTLARAGFTVVGIDLSRTLLSIAKFRQRPHNRASFVQADMRHLPACNSFDLLLNLFTSFGYFGTDDENQSVFNQFALILKPEGQFVFDYFNASYMIENLIPQQKEEISGRLIQQERRIHNTRVEKKITIQNNGHTAIFYESVKIYYPDAIFAMIGKAGLQIKKVFGDYDGRELSKCTPRLIVIGNKNS